MKLLKIFSIELPKLMLFLGVILAMFLFFKSVEFSLGTYDDLLKDPQVKVVSSEIDTKISFSRPELCDNDFCTQLNLNQNIQWKEASLFQYSLQEDVDFKLGLQNESVLYQLSIPAHLLKNSSDNTLAVPYIFLSRYGIYINKKLIQVGTGRDTANALSFISLPRNEIVDGKIVIHILGELKDGDLGLNSYIEPLIGPSEVIKSLSLDNERAMITYYLIFFVSLGTLFVLFSLLTLFTEKKEQYFNALMFTFFSLTDLLMRSDFLSNKIELSYMLILLNISQSMGSIFLFRFFSNILNFRLSRKTFIAVSSAIFLLQFIIAIGFKFHLHTLSIPEIFLLNKSIRFIIVLGAFIYSIDLAIHNVSEKFIRYFSFVLGLLVVLKVRFYFFESIESYNPFIDVMACLFITIYSLIEFGAKEKLVVSQRDIIKNQERDVAIGKTASLLAHDIRKPFAQLDMVLDQLKAISSNNELLEVASMEVKQGLRHVSTMVNEIMDFSREAKVQLKVVNLNDVVAEALKLANSNESHVIIDFKHSKSLLADRERLIRIFTNLFTNAFEAMPQGGELKVSTYNESDKIKIIVENDSDLIPTHILEKIFDPFVTHGKNQGTGLGLASVHKSVQLLDGKIDISNRKGKSGVVVKLEFKATDKKMISNVVDSTPVKIAVCDDSDFTRMIFCELVKTMNIRNCEILQFSNAEELISILDLQTINYLFTDYRMEDSGGVLNGIELIRYVKSKNADVNCILWSNSISVDMEQDAHLAGVSDLLLLPIDKEKLEKILNINSQSQEVEVSY